MIVKFINQFIHRPEDNWKKLDLIVKQMLIQNAEYLFEIFLSKSIVEIF